MLPWQHVYNVSMQSLQAILASTNLPLAMLHQKQAHNLVHMPKLSSDSASAGMKNKVQNKTQRM